MTADIDNLINEKPILLFDGVCNLCNSSVQFIIERDPEGKIRFSSLQSDIGQSLLKHFNLSTTDITTVVLVEKGKVYTKSSAALGAAAYLKRPWNLLSALRIFPKGIRNFFYDIIAKNRYKWFGEKASCMMPSTEIKHRFLD